MKRRDRRKALRTQRRYIILLEILSGDHHLWHCIKVARGRPLSVVRCGIRSFGGKRLHRCHLAELTLEVESSQVGEQMMSIDADLSEQI